MDVFSVVGLIAVAVILIIAGLAAVFFLRRRPQHPEPREARGQAAFPGQSRLEVLDTTDVDADRRLVLVRCDGIEHLIMTGGPSDVVVENDVRRVRGAAAAAERAFPSMGQERDRAPAAFAAPAVPTARPRPAEVNRPMPRPAAPSLDHAPVAAAPRAGNMGAAATPAPRPVAQPPRAEPPRAEPRAEAPRPERRNPPAPPAPMAARAVEQARPSARAPQNSADRQARPAVVSREAAMLPGAGTPWPEPDSLETEIVQALRFERNPEPNGATPPTHATPPTQEPVERERRMESAATTLGDLAERLEEALAREVQSTNQLRGVDLDPEPIASIERHEAPAPEARKRQEPRPRPEMRERQELARAVAPAQDRREEAPVISLDSRRKEAVDPLEDEMARLLGELTGDTKSR